VRGVTRGFVAPLLHRDPELQRPTQQPRGQALAETTAEIGGALIGLPQHAVTAIASRLAPRAVAAALGRVVNNLEVGAAYGVLDAVVSHFEELRQMPPKQAV